MAKFTVINKTARALGFHNHAGDVVEVKPGESIPNIELSQASADAISLVSDLQFEKTGGSSIDKGGDTKTSDLTNKDLVAQLNAAKSGIEQQDQLIAKLAEENAALKASNAALAEENAALKKTIDDAEFAALEASEKAGSGASNLDVPSLTQGKKK